MSFNYTPEQILELAELAGGLVTRQRNRAESNGYPIPTTPADFYALFTDEVEIQEQNVGDIFDTIDSAFGAGINAGNYGVFADLLHQAGVDANPTYWDRPNSHSCPACGRSSDSGTDKLCRENYLPESDCPSFSQCSACGAANTLKVRWIEGGETPASEDDRVSHFYCGYCGDTQDIEEVA